LAAYALFSSSYGRDSITVLFPLPLRTPSFFPPDADYLPYSFEDVPSFFKSETGDENVFSPFGMMCIVTPYHFPPGLFTLSSERRAGREVFLSFTVPSRRSPFPPSNAAWFFAHRPRNISGSRLTLPFPTSVDSARFLSSWLF